MCGIELYKTISQHFAMQELKKKNVRFEHFSCWIMTPWYCGFCLNEHHCFDRKTEQYHFKLCWDVNELKSAISAIKEDTLTPLQRRKIILTLKLSENTDQLTLAVLKTELKRKKQRIGSVFEEAYRKNQYERSQLAHSRKNNSSKTNSRAGVNNDGLNNVKTRHGKRS